MSDLSPGPYLQPWTLPLIFSCQSSCREEWVSSFGGCLASDPGWPTTLDQGDWTRGPLAEPSILNHSGNHVSVFCYITVEDHLSLLFLFYNISPADWRYSSLTKNRWKAECIRMWFILWNHVSRIFTLQWHLNWTCSYSIWIQFQLTIAGWTSQEIVITCFPYSVKLFGRNFDYSIAVH